jgi:hypothetical protein
MLLKQQSALHCSKSFEVLNDLDRVVVNVEGALGAFAYPMD